MWAVFLGNIEKFLLRRLLVLKTQGLQRKDYKGRITKTQG